MADQLTYTEMKGYVDALELPPDIRTHINHDECPAGTDTKRRLYVYNTGVLHLFKCHHCGGQGYVRNENRTLRAEDIADKKDVLVGTSVHDVEVPFSTAGAYDVWRHEAKPIDRDTPLEMLLWLYSYGFTEELCFMFQIRYTSRGVYLPVRNSTDAVVVVQCRTFSKGAQKYYTQKLSDSCPIVNPIKPDTKFGKTVVLTEDILSAYKVAMAGMYAIPLCGTKLHTSVLGVLEKFYGDIIVWFDNDTAGITGSCDVIRTLRSTVPNPIIDATGKFEQPKECSIETIKQVLLPF